MYEQSYVAVIVVVYVYVARRLAAPKGRVLRETVVDMLVHEAPAAGAWRVAGETVIVSVVVTEAQRCVRQASTGYRQEESTRVDERALPVYAGIRRSSTSPWVLPKTKKKPHPVVGVAEVHLLDPKCLRVLPSDVETQVLPGPMS